MGNDALSTLTKASEVLLKMGFTRDEISAYLLDGGKKSMLVMDDAVDVMTLYFRAQKLLSDKHVRDIMNKYEAFKGSASVPRDVESLYAIESFVDTLDRSLVIRDVGSGKQEVIRTWENYFKEKEDKFVKDMKNKGKATRRQKETYEAIKENPYDLRIKAYLNDYLDDQTKKDIIYAINDDANALLVVKGLPFAVGKLKQESYTDITLKYLYADSQISKYQAENMKLKNLNKSLKAQIEELEASGKGLSEVESAIMLAIANGNKAYINALEASNAKVADMITESMNFILASNDDVRDDLSGKIITNGRARKREHAAQNEKLNKISKKATLAAILAGATLVSGGAGAVAGIVTANHSKKEVNAYKNYAVVENGEFVDFQNLLNELKVGGLTVEEEQQLLAKIDEYSKNDNASLGMPSTPSMQAILSAAKNENTLADMTTKYNQVVADYEALKNSQATGTFDYVEVLNKIVNITNNLAESLNDNTLSSAEKAALKVEIDALSSLKDDVAKQMAEKFGVSLNIVMDSIDYQVADLKNQITELNNNLDEMKAQKVTDNALIAGQAAKITELSNTINILEDQLKNSGADAELVKQLAEAQAELANAKSKIAELEIQNNSLSGQVSSLTSQINTLNNTITRLEDESITDAATIASLNNVIETLNNTISNLENQLANSGDAALKAELEQAKKDLAAAQAKISELESGNTSLENTISDLRGETAELKSEIADLKTEVSGLKADNVNLTNEVASYIKEVAIINQERDKAIADYNAKVAEYNQLVDQYEALLNSGDGAKIAELEAEIQKANADLVAANNQIDSLNKEIASLEAEVSNLTNQLASSDATFLKQLYTKLTGKSANGLSNAEIQAYLADAFDISAGNQNSGALEDEGATPEK